MRGVARALVAELALLADVDLVVERADVDLALLARVVLVGLVDLFLAGVEIRGLGVVERVVPAVFAVVDLVVILVADPGRLVVALVGVVVGGELEILFLLGDVLLVLLLALVALARVAGESVSARREG